jgi:hypothetical protein
MAMMAVVALVALTRSYGEAMTRRPRAVCLWVALSRHNDCLFIVQSHELEE